MEQLPPDLFYYIAISFAAQLVDGALGVAHGVKSRPMPIFVRAPVIARGACTLLSSTGAP